MVHWDDFLQKLRCAHDLTKQYYSFLAFISVKPSTFCLDHFLSHRRRSWGTCRIRFFGLPCACLVANSQHTAPCSTERFQHNTVYLELLLPTLCSCPAAEGVATRKAVLSTRELFQCKPKDQYLPLINNGTFTIDSGLSILVWPFSAGGLLCWITIADGAHCRTLLILTKGFWENLNMAQNSWLFALDLAHTSKKTLIHNPFPLQEKSLFIALTFRGINTVNISSAYPNLSTGTATAYIRNIAYGK